MSKSWRSQAKADAVTLPDALEAGLLIHHEENGRTELRTPDKRYRVWYSGDERHLPWRACRVTTKGTEQDGWHGGAGSLSRLLWQIVYADDPQPQRAAE